MCFSATASFAAGLALCTIGTLTLRRARVAAQRPLAAIPAIFGVQQLVEGALWLALPEQAASAHALAHASAQGLAVLYLLFSHVLWPIYLPFAVWMIEPESIRRRWIAGPMVAGLMIGLFFAAIIATQPVSATIAGLHIQYHLPHPHEGIAFALYALAACIAPLLSSQRSIRWLGVAITVSMVGAYAVYATWFASVWCFFAAWVSAIIYLHFARRGVDAAPMGGEPI